MTATVEVDVQALRAKGKTPKGHFEHPEHRRSLSGKFVGLEPAKAWWMYKPAEKVPAEPRTGAFYATLDTEPRERVFVCECGQPTNDGADCLITMSPEHLSTEFKGANRQLRRQRGERTGYVRGLHMRLGQE